MYDDLSVPQYLSILEMAKEAEGFLPALARYIDPQVFLNPDMEWDIFENQFIEPLAAN